MSFFQQEDPVEVHSSDPVYCIDQFLHIKVHIDLLCEVHGAGMSYVPIKEQTAKAQ